MRKFESKEKALEACRFVGHAPGDIVWSTQDNWEVRNKISSRRYYFVLAVSPGRYIDDASHQYIPVTAVVSFGSRIAEYRSCHSDTFVKCEEKISNK